MKTPDKPSNETQRLCALYRLNILDTPPDERFDNITAAAKRYFDVAYALISLVDEDRQWFKSNQGLDAEETPRDISFCGHAIHQDDVFYIPDASKDVHFADNPLVTGPPNIRFYGGVTVHSADGYALGTLCIIDDAPREMTPNDFVVLREFRDMAEQVIREFLTLRDVELS